MFKTTKLTKATVLGFFTVLLIAVLCLVLGSTPPLQASAARKTQYVSEIKFADLGDWQASQAWLSDNKYVVQKPVSMNGVGADSSGAYGVKYTTDPNNALTDIKVMNMSGGYSFAEYDSFIEMQEEKISEFVDILADGIKLFQQGVKEEWPSTMFGLNMLNHFSEDDSKKLLGDLLTTTNPSTAEGKAILSKVFMQSNGAVLSVIKKAIAISCLPKNNDNWMQEASELSKGANGQLKIYKSGEANKFGTIATDIWESMLMIQKDLAFYEKWFKSFVAIYGNGLDENGNSILVSEEKSKEMDEYIKESFKNQEFSYAELSAVYAALTVYAYTDSDYPEIKNLADVIIRSNTLTVNDIFPIARSFSETQSKIMYVTSIVPFILNVENTKEFWDKAISETKKIGMLKDVSTTSVYAGVDRSMFVKGGIAMTSDAIRENVMNPEANPFIGNIDFAAEVALWTAIGIAGAIAVGALVCDVVFNIGSSLHFVKVGSAAYNLNIFGSLTAQANIAPSTVSTFGSISGKDAYARGQYASDVGTKLGTSAKVFMAAMAVALIISIVFIALELNAYYNKERTRMPVSIVDNQYKNGKNSYIKYDSLKMNTETNGVPDVFDYNRGGGNQWQILYATKDKRAGAPITEVKIASATFSTDTNITSVALFGEKAERDLCKYAAGWGALSPQVMYFKQDLNAFPIIGSVFSSSTFVLSVCGVVLGGVALAILAAWFIINTRNKKKNVIVAGDTKKTTEK